MKKGLVILTLALIIPNLIFALPQKMKEVRICEEEERMMIWEKLKLTDQQKEQIHSIRVDYKKKRIPLEADLKLAHIDLDELIKSEAPQKKIDEAVKRINDLKSKEFSLRIEERLALLKVMTPEQKKILEKHPGFFDLHPERGMMERRDWMHFHERGREGKMHKCK